jgi:hypothetical protein
LSQYVLRSTVLCGTSLVAHFSPGIFGVIHPFGGISIVCEVFSYSTSFVMSRPCATSFELHSLECLWGASASCECALGGAVACAPVLPLLFVCGGMLVPHTAPRPSPGVLPDAPRPSRGVSFTPRPCRGSPDLTKQFCDGRVYYVHLSVFDVDVLLVCQGTMRSQQKQNIVL